MVTAAYFYRLTLKMLRYVYHLYIKESAIKPVEFRHSTLVLKDHCHNDTYGSDLFLGVTILCVIPTGALAECRDLIEYIYLKNI